MQAVTAVTVAIGAGAMYPKTNLTPEYTLARAPKIAEEVAIVAALA